MRELEYVAGRFGAWLCLGAFGLGLAGALLAGVDPMVAVLRAGGLTVALVVVYVAMWRSLAPLLKSAPPEPIPEETDPVENVPPKG